MYKIEYLQSKNSSKTCKINGIFLHSAYNPQSESERFVENINIGFKPELIFIIEPALSWCAEPLKKRFPKIKICAIRLLPDFYEYDQLFDYSFYFDEKNLSSFENEVSSCFTEKELCSAFFLEWIPSKKIFDDKIKILYKSIKNIIEKSKASLVTESYFSKRWFKNSIIFNCNIKKTCIFNKGNFPVVICASGPSLNSSISFLKKFRKNYFLIAASSSISVLLNNQIIPDLVLSTDGGFWAKNHLVYDYKKYNFPVALTCESAFPKKLIENATIFPLVYQDGSGSELTKIIFQKLNIPFREAQRNGTVSGTLFSLAETLTDSFIFACGLDLESPAGKQHAEPNRNEISNRKYFFRLKNAESFNSRSRFNSQSLKIYNSWFSNLSEELTTKFFRLSDNYPYSTKLGAIKDVNFDFFEKKLNECSKNSAVNIQKIENPEINENTKTIVRKEIQKYINENENNDKFLFSIFPSEEVLLKKLTNETEIMEMNKKIEKRKKEFFISLKKVLGD